MMDWPRVLAVPAILLSAVAIVTALVTGDLATVGWAFSTACWAATAGLRRRV